MAATVGGDVLGYGAARADVSSAKPHRCTTHATGLIFDVWRSATSREHSSGTTRRLRRLTERGDSDLRTLLIHGARSALLAAKLAQKQGKPLDRTQEWALALAERAGHNKAAVALANKTVRRLWAADRHGQAFDPNHLSTHRAH